MKKVLSTVAALGLVAGLASTASAVEFSMSGNYVAEGIYFDKGTGNGVDLNTNDASSDAWYQHTFELKPTMKVNDKISMFSTVRLADDSIWGNQDDTAGSMAANNDVYVHHLYMDYASPIGKIRVGRTPAGPYGTSFADTDVRADRIMLWPSFLKSGSLSTLFYIQKSTEGDAYDATSSSDNDHYEARLYYKNENLDSGIRYGFTNSNAANHDNEKQSASIYGKYKRENLFFNGELTHNFGDNTATVDYDSWGAMLELGAKMDALTPSLMYFYASGDNNSTDTDNEVFGTNTTTQGVTGSEFTPLYILTGRQTGLLNADQYAADTDALSAGVHAIVAAVDFAASDRLTLHGAIGWAQADAEKAGWDDEYGWEYNVGAAYKLLDNLTYEAHFGYLDTGDFFEGGVAGANTENVYLLTHHLTMTF